MFSERNIVYFTPFYFKNGNPAKHKYFVVIKNIGGLNVLASLPTRKDSVPNNLEIEYGCVEDSSINFNCFVIPAEKEVTECGKKFDFKTHIYGHELDSHEISTLSEIYQIENTDYEIWGIMKEDIYNELIECLKNSKSVKMKFIKLLT